MKTLILKILKEEAMKKLQGVVDAESDKALHVKGKGPRATSTGDNTQHQRTESQYYLFQLREIRALAKRMH